MIAPYCAVGLVPTVHGIETRADIMRNIAHIEELANVAFFVSELDLPVKLMVIPEGGLQGFQDEAFDTPMAEFVERCAIDIPGPETDRLAELAKRLNVYLIAQAKSRDPDWPGLFFNVGFIISPLGDIVLKHRKMTPLLPCERSISPHDLFDAWIEKYGRSLQSFWPVVDTPIGRLGIMMAMEGSYPENGRGLAMNGAEIVYRASIPAPFASSDMFEISNRARALENNMYVIAPNIGAIVSHVDPTLSIDSAGGSSMIVNHRGQIIARQTGTNNSTFISAVIDVEAQRHHRLNAAVANWMKDIRAETAQLIYENAIYPKNFALENAPIRSQRYKREFLPERVKEMVRRGIWKKSIYDE